MSRLNVLSIDWDYFVKVSTEDRMKMFPDGGNENFPLGLQSIIWSSYYCYGLEECAKTDTRAIRKLKKRMYGQYIEPMVCLVAESHKHCYQFIKDCARDFGYEDLNVVNIDFHHDIYKNGDEVDCGNWFRKIIEEFDNTDSKFTWVKRDDSDDSVYSDDSDNIPKKLEVTEDIDILFEYDWDIIFVCKSGMWSPPHLDSNFRDCFKGMLDAFYVKYESTVFGNRYADAKRMADAQLSAMEKAVYANAALKDDTKVKVKGEHSL